MLRSRYLQRVCVGSTANTWTSGHTVQVGVSTSLGRFRLLTQIPTCILPSVVAQMPGAARPGHRQGAPAGGQPGGSWKAVVGATLGLPIYLADSVSPAVPVFGLVFWDGRGRDHCKWLLASLSVETYLFPVFEPDSCVKGSVDLCLHY